MVRIYRQSRIVRDSITLNVNSDIVGEIPGHTGIYPLNARGMARLNPLDEECELRNPSSNVGQNISSRLEPSTLSDKPGEPIVSTSMRCNISSKRRHRRQVATVKRQTSMSVHSDDCNTLFTLVLGVSGLVDGSVRLDVFPFWMLFLS